MTDVLPLLYQGGYLTIKDYDPITHGFTLGIPNKEVRAGLMENLLPFYSGKSDGQSLGFAALFYRDLMHGEIDVARTYWLMFRRVSIITRRYSMSCYR